MLGNCDRKVSEIEEVADLSCIAIINIFPIRFKLFS